MLAVIVIAVLIILAIIVIGNRPNSSAGFHDHDADEYPNDNTSDLARKRALLDTGLKSRRDFYREDYLKSEAWKRKRFVVLRRDNWQCVYCDSRATQVHHKRYARRNIGKEPIDWLVSICKSCHAQIHKKA